MNTPAGFSPAECTRFNALILPEQDWLFTLAVTLMGSEEKAEETVEQALKQAFRSTAQPSRESLTARLVHACRQAAPLRSLPPKRGLSARWTDARDYLAVLPFETRAAVALVELGRFSYAEAARILGCSEREVLQQLCAGRRALIPLLADRF